MSMQVREATILYTRIKVNNVVEDKRTLEEKIRNLNELGVKVKVINNIDRESKKDRIRVILGRMANVLTERRI
jgi:hypothetical protein